MRGVSCSVVNFFENLPGFPFVEHTPQDDLKGRKKRNATLVLAMHINLANLQRRLILRRTSARISRIQALAFYPIFPYCAQT